ncbi:MAG: helix-turn-helix transcriptional regulator [Clostridia bacterium]|nr:helix-turn-helix transcriptional regulator [Clostridia bacterium]
MSFGTNIGYLRKKKGITQEELAERMYVSRQTISRWETDSVYPDVETVIRLCEILECDMETLVRGDASAKEEPAPVPVQEKEQEKEQEPEKAHKLEAKAEIELELSRSTVLKVVTDMLFPIATLAYLVMGFVWDLWHPGWLVFVVAAFLSPILSAINRPKMRRKKERAENMSGVDWDALNAAFCSIVFLIAIPAYLVMGFVWNLWHPGWLIFVAATVLCGISSIMCTLVFQNLDKKKD